MNKIPVKLIAEILSVSTSQITSTWADFKANGEEGIKTKKLGRPLESNLKLSKEQSEDIKKMITHNTPDQLKLNSSLWDLNSISALVQRRHKIHLPRSTMSVYLKRWGFSPQRPKKRNDKQQPDMVSKWLNVDFPLIKQKSIIEKGEIFWGDETGIQNETHYVRGYAPIGQTPVLKVAAPHIKINMISAISNQGKTRFMIYKTSMNQQMLITFMTRLIKDVSKKVFLILDNLKVHHGKMVKEWLDRHKDKIELFFYPLMLQNTTQMNI
jgi:transposase